MRDGILAIDEGTTGVTCLVLSANGETVARTYSEFTQSFPRPGWVEHDAEEIWTVTRRLAKQALEEAQAAGVRAVAIGITNQRETIVVWERDTLRPVHPAIVWQDRRTTELCQALKEAGHEEAVRAKTGLVLDPYFSGSKLMWLLREFPDLRRRAERGELAVGTIDTWLIARLTGGEVHATDPTNASRTLLFDLHTRTWGPALTDLFEVPMELLPEVRASSGHFGVTTSEAVGVELPIQGVAGDQQAALFGQGCWQAGLAKNTYGTGAFMLLNTGDEFVPSASGLLTTIACNETGGVAYALEGSIFIAGAAIQWLRDGLGLIERAEESEALAAELTDNEGVYLVPAFVGLGAPHWVPEARGMLVGLTRGSGRRHLVRAGLEAMAFGTADVLDAMVADSGVETVELRVDGGAARNDWLMQFQADMLGIPVRRPAQVETTALGAAGLAGLAAGVWPSADAFLAAQTAPDRFKPAMDGGARKRALGGWKRAVAAARAWAEYQD